MVLSAGMELFTMASVSRASSAAGALVRSPSPASDERRCASEVADMVAAEGGSGVLKGSAVGLAWVVLAAGCARGVGQEPRRLEMSHRNGSEWRRGRS